MKLNAVNQYDKAELFRSLHAANSGFVIPNPWDIGTARLLSMMGFKALATTSAGFAFSKGRPDKALQRDQVLKHLSDIAMASDLPVSADLENGFGDTPKEVVQTIRLAIETGIVGGSIEDTNGLIDSPLYPRELATERIRAAAEFVRTLPFKFTLMARAENYRVDRADLNDTIGRLQAYQEAGADVLFAPGLVRLIDVASLVREVDRPVNVLIGFPGFTGNVNDLFALGVKRVSVGGTLARAALGAFLRGARELRDRGTFEYAADAVCGNELNLAFGDVHEKFPR